MKVRGLVWVWARAGGCPAGQAVNSDRRGIFDDLSAAEIEAVVNYTRQIVCLNQLAADDDISSSDDNVSHIAVIELRPPIKHKALQHLDEGRHAPQRNARVVIYRPVTVCTLKPHSARTDTVFSRLSAAVVRHKVTSKKNDGVCYASGFQTGVRGPKGVRDGFPGGPREDPDLSLKMTCVYVYPPTLSQELTVCPKRSKHIHHTNIACLPL